MEKIKEMDIFSTDTQFTVMGMEAISNWKTKVATLLVLLAAIGISLNTFRQVWVPLSSIPIISRFIISNTVINPFIIGVNYQQIQDKGKVRFLYQNQQIQQIPCPAKLNSTISQCYLTPEVNLSQSNISILSSAIGYYSTYIQMFSLNNSLHNQPQSQNYYKIDYMPSMIFTLALDTIQLEIQNSIINSKKQTLTHPLVNQVIWGSPTAHDESSNNNLNGIQIQSTICLSQSETSIQYQIKRITLLQVLLVFISWIKTFSSVIGIVVIINIFTMKSHISYELYQSRYSQNLRISRWKSIRLWVYDALCGIGLQKQLSKLGLFKQEYLLSKAYQEVDHKISLNNIYRVMASIEDNKQIPYDNSCQSIDSQKPINGVDCVTQNVIVSSQAESPIEEEEEIDLNYSFCEEVKYTPYTPLTYIFPSQHDKASVFRTILEAINVNPLRIKLLSKRSEKSSIFSIVVTCIGISVIIPCLIYLGGFSETPTNTVQTRLLNQLKYQFNTDSRIFVNLIRQTNDTSHTPQAQFVLFDTDNNIIKSHTAYPNCTRNLPQPQLNNSYCFHLPLTIQRNIEDNTNTKLGIVFNSPDWMLNFIQINFMTSRVKPNTVQQESYNRTFVLFPSQYRQFQLTLIQKDTDGKIEQLSSLQMLESSNTPLLTGNQTGFIFSLARELKVLKATDTVVLSYLKNIWTISYAFFTILLTFIILPYNNRVAKGSILSKVKSKKNRTSSVRESEIEIEKREIEDQIHKERMVFSVENMMQVLYSKFYEMKLRTPFLKKSLN